MFQGMMDDRPLCLVASVARQAPCEQADVRNSEQEQQQWSSVAPFSLDSTRSFAHHARWEWRWRPIRLALPLDTWAARLPEGRVSLYNLQTDERLSVTYRTESGAYDQGALNDLNHLLRCHHTNESTMMDVRLIEFVNLVQRRIGGRRDVYIVSGYRSPEYNEQLIRMGTRAARNSYHVLGQAVDVQMPGVPLRTLREVALRYRCGGVGLLSARQVCPP